MLSSVQKAAAWDKTESSLTPEEKIYIENPALYEEVSGQGFDIEKLGAMQHQSAWPDVELKAKNIRESGGIVNWTKEPRDPVGDPAGVVKIEGLIRVDPELSTFGVATQYTTQIFFPHPLSRAAIAWSCECAWHEWVWSRKKYRGRFCSHALALYKETVNKEVNYIGVPRPVYEKIREELITDNRLSPRQLDEDVKKNLRKQRVPGYFYDEDIAPGALYDQDIKEKFPEIFKDVEEEPGIRFDEVKIDWDRVRRELDPLTNQFVETISEKQEEEQYFGKSYEKILEEVWDKSVWPEPGPFGPGTPRLSMNETKKSLVLREKINDLMKELEELPARIQEKREEYRALIDEEQRWKSLYEDLRKSGVPMDDPLVQEKYDEYGLENSNIGFRTQVRAELERIKQEKKKVKNEISNLAPRDKQKSKGPDASPTGRHNILVREIENLKRQLRLELLNSKNKNNYSKINDATILNMIRYISQFNYEKAIEFSNMLESGEFMSEREKEQRKRDIRNRAERAMDFADRLRADQDRDRLVKNIQNYYAYLSRRSKGEFQKTPPGEIDQQEVQRLLDQRRVPKEDLQPQQKPQKAIVEEEWVDEKGERGPKGKVWKIKREISLDPENPKESSITVLSSEININDITIYLQREIAKKNSPAAYTRRAFWGEQRGGLIPHPDAYPMYVDQNGANVYSQDDLGYDPSSGQMGAQEEDRGSYAKIPIGSEVLIKSVDPRDRLVLIRYQYNNPPSNHQYIEVWVPLKEVDLI